MDDMHWKEMGFVPDEWNYIHQTTCAKNARRSYDKLVRLAQIVFSRGVYARGLMISRGDIGISRENLEHLRAGSARRLERTVLAP